MARPKRINGKTCRIDGELQSCDCGPACGCGSTNPTRWKLTLTGATLPKIAAEFQNAFGAYECLRHILLDPCVEDIDGEYVTERVSPTDACFHRAKFAPCMWSFAQESSFGSQHQSYYLVADVTTLRYNEGDVWFGEGDPPPPGVYGTVRFYTVGYGDNTYQYCDSCGAGGGPLSYSAELATLWYSTFTIPDVEGVPADCREIGEISLTNTAPAWCGSFKPDVDIFPPGTTVTIEPVPADDETEPVEFSTDVSPCTDCQPEPAILKLHYPLIPCSEGGLTNLWVSYETKNADLDYTTAMFDGQCYTVSEVGPTELDALPEGAIIIDALAFESCALCECQECAGVSVRVGASATLALGGFFDDFMANVWGGFGASFPPPGDFVPIDLIATSTSGGLLVFEDASGTVVITIDCITGAATFGYGGPMVVRRSDTSTDVSVTVNWYFDSYTATINAGGITFSGDRDDSPATVNGTSVLATFNATFATSEDVFCD